MPLNDTLNQIDMKDIYRIFHTKTSAYTLFSSVHGKFSRRDHILGQKPNFNKLKKTEVIPCIFSDHSSVKLESNHKKIIWKEHQYMEDK